jgi:hypothetical protein
MIDQQHGAFFTQMLDQTRNQWMKQEHGSDIILEEINRQMLTARFWFVRSVCQRSLDRTPRALEGPHQRLN